MPIRRFLAAAAALPLLTLLTAAAEVTPIAAMKNKQDPDDCLTVKKVTYAPGQGSPSHSHDATVIAYVLKGAVESRVDEAPLRTYRPGEHWVEEAGAQHTVSRNASANQPATFLAIMLSRRGTAEAKACGY